MIRIRNLALGPDLYQDIFDWDIRTWSHALEIWDKEIDGEKHCLEIGANKGGLSLWLALNGHTCLCTDLDNPQERAEAIHNKHQVGHLIDYAALDVLDVSWQVDSLSRAQSRGSRSLLADDGGELDIQPPVPAPTSPQGESFDLIIFKSILGGISRDKQLHRAKEAITNMHALLKPGGTILFAENLRGSFMHRLARKLFVKWGDSWNYLTISELEELFSEFESVEIKATGFATAFGKGKRLSGFFGFWDQWVFNPLFGKGMKYVGYGKGRKRKET